MTDEVHSDGAAKWLPRHIQEEQVPTTAAGGSEMIVVLSAVSEDEVESVVEADAACIKGTDLGGGRPAMCAGEVVQERFCRAKEVTVLARAVARSVWARLIVVILIIVRTPVWQHSHGLHSGMRHGCTPTGAPWRGTCNTPQLALN